MRSSKQFKEKGLVNKEKTIEELILEVLDTALTTKDLGLFLNSIAHIGCDKTDAKCCAIYLLDEDGRTLELKALYPTDNETFKNRKIKILVPRRRCFSSEEEGLNQLMRYLVGKGFSTEELQGKPKPFTDMIKESEKRINELIEAGTIPMGLIAFVIKEGEALLFDFDRIYKHPESLGLFEIVNEIWTSLVLVPIRVRDEVVGVITIENHKDSLSLYDPALLEDVNIYETIYMFSRDHLDVATILGKCITLAAEKIIYGDKTFGNLFGSKLLMLINRLDADKTTPMNTLVRRDILRFYSKFRLKIEDISGVDEIYALVLNTIRLIAQTVKLKGILPIIDGIAPSLESVLGTDIHYREHFIHQFQVFLLGYYLINSVSSLRESLVHYLQQRYGNLRKKGKKYGLDHVLQIWFISSIFHDYAISVEKMDTWLDEYFSRMHLQQRGSSAINWAELFTKYEYEKIKLLVSFQKINGSGEGDIANMIKDVFIYTHDHGLIGALILMNVLKDKVEEPLLIEASTSIALHNDDVYKCLKNLSLGQCPFGFLLAFCDTAQQYGRPSTGTWFDNFTVALEDVKLSRDDQGERVEVFLRYNKQLEDEEKKKIHDANSTPREFWHSKVGTVYAIILTEEGLPIGSVGTYDFSPYD